MDLTKQNLETLASLRLRNATIEERVAADRELGESFHFYGGIWWRRVRPFFYLPASFLLPLRPHESRPSPWRALGGYYHVASAHGLANSSIVTNEISDPGRFELAMLKKNKNGARKVREIETGLSTLRIQRVENLDDLLGDGLRLFRHWEQKTGDVWSKDLYSTNFKLWAEQVLRHPYDVLLGAYFETRLVGFAQIKSTDGVANLVNSLGDHSMYKTHQASPTTVLNYAYIRICGQSPGIQKATNGMRSLKDSLERYKAELGYRHVTYPAFVCLRPPVRSLVRFFLPIQYRRLTCDYSSLAPGTLTANRARRQVSTQTEISTVNLMNMNQRRNDQVT